MHWAHIGRGFGWDTPPKFANPMGFAIVSIDKFDIAQPHVHGAGCEEIWCQLKGTSLLLFGNRLFHQEPGEAFLIPPNRKVPHSSINATDEPMLWLYMGNRHDQVANGRRDGSHEQTTHDGGFHPGGPAGRRRDIRAAGLLQEAGLGGRERQAHRRNGRSSSARATTSPPAGPSPTWPMGGDGHDLAARGRSSLPGSRPECIGARAISSPG